MIEKDGVTGTRRPYRRPQLEQVQLVAEEAVLQNCKKGSDLGPNMKNCKTQGVDCVIKGS